MPNGITFANIPEATPPVSAHVMSMPLASPPVPTAIQREQAGAWVQKMLGDPDAWGDPEQRTSMMKILAEVSVEMADLDATVVTVHPADSVPSQVDHSNARKLEVFHSSKRVDSRVMVAIEERIGTRPCYIGWGVPTFEGFADAMGAALDSRAKGLAIGRTWRVKGRGEAGDFGARLGEALRRCAADHPDRLLRLAERTTRIA